MCSISLAGQSGPLSDKPGFDYMGAAYAGITSCIGETDRGPAQLPIAISDSATGVTAAMAVGFALLHRERTGEGQYIDCSLIDTYFNMHEVNVPKSSLRGAQFDPPRMGSLHPDGGPTGVFRCRDDEFIVDHGDAAPMAADGQGHEHAGTGRGRRAFATRAARRDNNEALKDVIEALARPFREP